MATTSQRRKRYVATVIDPTGVRRTQDVRAYSQERGEARLIELKYTVLSIRPYKRGERVEIPRGGGWNLSFVALRKAREELGIEWPVIVKQTGHKGSQRGVHSIRFEDGKPYHHICIKNYLTPDQAGRTLWHELRHCQQTEALARRYDVKPGTREYSAAYRIAYQKGTNYNSKRWETEARDTESRNDDMPLARR